MMTGNTEKHPNARHPDQAYLDALSEHGGEANTTDLASTLDVTPRTVRNRLNDLADAGCVERITVGQAILWRISDEE